MTTQETIHQTSDTPASGPLPAGPAPQAASSRWERRDLFDDPRRKSPVLAAVLSLLPGLGQVYVGYYRQGFVNALMVGTIITMLTNNAVRHMEPLFGIFLAFFWLYNVIDAARRASLYNQALAGLGPSELPGDLPSPTGHGSLAGGLALVALGCLLLSNTLFGVSLQWVQQWWPLALVGLGLYLAVGPLMARWSASKSDAGDA